MSQCSTVRLAENRDLILFFFCKTAFLPIENTEIFNKHQQKIATSDGFRDLWLRLLRDSGGGTVSGNTLCQMDDGGASFLIVWLEFWQTWSLLLIADPNLVLKKKLEHQPYKSVDITVIWTQLFRWANFFDLPNLAVRSSGVCILAWNVATSCRTWTFNCFKAGLAV